MSIFQKISNEDISFLLENIVQDKTLKKKLYNKKMLKEDDIAVLWDLCTDAINLELDINYEPTEKGKKIEALIDKFYFMGENYSPEGQYQTAALERKQKGKESL